MLFQEEPPAKRARPMHPADPPFAIVFLAANTGSQLFSTLTSRLAKFLFY
jgi:hypothetical protein